MPNSGLLQDDSVAEIENHLKVEFELDDADIVEMIGDYFSNLERLLKEAEASIASGNAEGLRKAGHSIKGVAGNLGSPSISRQGKFIEDNAKPGFNPELFQPALESIHRQYEKLKAERAQ